VLSMSSGTFAFLQLLVMPTLMRRFKIASLFIFCMGVWPITFMLVPLLNLIARSGLDRPTGTFNPLLWVGIAVVLICWRGSCLAYPYVVFNTDSFILLTSFYSTNAILVRNNAPGPSSLGAANGLNLLSMSVSRCTSPAFVGCVSSLLVKAVWLLISRCGQDCVRPLCGQSSVGRASLAGYPDRDWVPRALRLRESPER